ncbi:MAG: M23 family metallopeptidase [Salinibacter sp.]
MWSFVADFFRNLGTERTVVLIGSEEAGKARRYRIRPARLLGVWGGSLLIVGLVVGLLVAFTPLRTQIPGYGTKQIRKSARLNAMRLQALQDSLATQRRYVKQLRQLITGRVASTARPNPAAPAQSSSGRAQPFPTRKEDRTASGSDRGIHEQPAMSPSVVTASGSTGAVKDAPPLGLSFPLSPPVASGFPTRGFNANTGHYGIDVAVSQGEYIRAVAAGYVVWADWTQDGGYTIAVQHADGYLSVYKHNRRLLKRIGDRVQAQEPLAVSGNTGVITTGPHLHFELWRNGLAQEPESYVAGW